jgi:hypothetical protein
MSDLTEAVVGIKNAAPKYELARDYYRGDKSEVFANPKLRRLLGESADEYKVNLAKVPVNTVLNGLEVTSVQVPGGEGSDKSLTTILVDDVWVPNEMDSYVPDWLREIGYQGDSYLIVWDGEEENTCEVHMCRALHGRMFYETENPRKKRFFAMMWKEGSPQRTRVTLYYMDRIERYVSNAKDPKSYKDFKRFEEDGAAWPQPNPYEEIPVFHGRSDHPYGVPDHYDAYGPQNMITKLNATSMASVDFQGFPIRAALMGEGLDDGGDDWDDGENEGTGATGIGDGEQGNSQLVAHPGRLWQLYNVKELVQLDPANPDAFLKPLNEAKNLMSVATGTPLRFFTGSNGQAPSGESLREDDKPLTERKKHRRRMAGAALSDALTFAMRKVLGHRDCPEVVVQWAPLERATGKEDWDTVSAKQGAGVPRDVTLQEAGYTPEQTTQWSENQADPEGTLASRVALLNVLGDAVQKLATAATLGALDMGAVQEMVAGFLPEGEEGDEPPAPPSPSIQEQAAIIQKIYLGVPAIMDRDEARAMLARAGIEVSTDTEPPVEGQ